MSMDRQRATLRSLSLASVLLHSDNKRVSGFGYRLRPNLLRFAPQTLDTRPTLTEMPLPAYKNILTDGIISFSKGC